MAAETQPDSSEDRSAWQMACEVFLSAVGAGVILGCLYVIALWSNHVDLYSPTTTAVGGFVTCLAMLWPLVASFTGPGALHPADTAQGSRFIATAGVIVTIGGVIADDHLGWPALGIIAIAAAISFLVLLAAFFGLAGRRQRIKGKASKQHEPIK